MPRSSIFSSRELADMILIYGESGRSGRRAISLYRERFPDRRAPMDPRVIIRALQRVRDDIPVTGRVIVPENVTHVPAQREERILQHFAANPEASTRSAGRRFGMNHSTVHKILKRDKQHPYKFTKVHALLPRDLPPRVAFCDWLLRQHENNRDFLSRIIWTDESTFTRNGVWNQRNTHYWARVNPHVAKETGHQYRWSVNVWAAIHGDRIIGPVFIDGNLNGDKFLELINGTLADYVNALPEAERMQTWLQLDGAPAHSSVRVRNALNAIFQDRWIGRFGPRRWPARSPDLTPLDFYLWGTVKNEVYSQPRTTVEQLREKIADVIEHLQQVDMEKVRQSLLRRCVACCEVQGRHVENRYLRGVNRNDFYF